MTAYHHLVCALLRRAWQRWRQRPRLDEMNAYLSQASNHADLEQRIRAWDEAGRLDHMPLR